jgi:spermidine synthase
MTGGERWTREEIAPGEVHAHHVVAEVFVQESPFQRIEVLETEGYGRGLFLDGRIQHVQGDEYTYSESMVHPAMLLLEGRADRVMIIGGGPGGIVRELLRYAGVRRIVQVDIDTTVIEVARRYLTDVAAAHWDDPRFELVTRDALQYLGETEEPFDLVVNDLSEPVPGSPAGRLFTADAWRLVRSRLQEPHGLFVTWAGSVGARSADMAARITRMLRGVFPHVYPYVTHPQSYGTIWLTLIAALRERDPLALGIDAIDGFVAGSVEGELALYDGRTHHHCFLLPKDVRALLDRAPEDGTADGPIVLDVVADRPARPPGEDFRAIVELYDGDMPENNLVHDLVYPLVYGEGEYIGQFSDNSASEIRHMGERMELATGSRVLEVGVGTAPVACYLAQELGWHVTGIDISATPLEKARARVAADGRVGSVDIVHGNVYEHAFPTRFDGIYGTGAFCHFNAERLFARCRSLLRPGGVLAFMERVRLGEVGADAWQRLTAEWACPWVYTTDEYVALLRQVDFSVTTVEDLTPTFRVWQARSITAREELRDEIIARTTPEYYETSLRLAEHENSVTASGKLGYVLVVARAR